MDGSITLSGTRRFDTDCNNATTDPQWLRSLSFDSARGRLLVMTGRRQHDDDSGFSLVSAPVCHECSENGTHIQAYFVDAQISPPQFKVGLRCSSSSSLSLPRDATQSAVMRLHVVCPSVRLSVTFRYRDHIGWNSSKIISRPNSLRPVRSLTATWAIWCNGNTSKIRVE